MKREIMEFDVVIVGAGPAGLSTAIHLAQLARESNKTLSIAILDKGAYVGAHILSGAVLEVDALQELIPDWHKQRAPVHVPVTQDEFLFLTKTRAVKLPVPPNMQNHGNFIISLGQLCQWLQQYAEGLGINVFPGFAASKILFSADNNTVIGVQTGDMGLDKNGHPSQSFQPGIELHAQQTIFAEGCRGSLTEQLIKHFKLRAGKDPQSYAIGIKELWKITAKKHQLGKVLHTLGWPLDRKTYGGGFVYHFENTQLAVGFVVGLDYQNPYLDPFQELQRFKSHPCIKPLLADAECVAYGARALNEGGWQSIPRLVFPGGLLVGCGAGMVNVGKIKGIHNAIRSGMLAASAIMQNFSNLKHKLLFDYQTQFDQSKIYRELYISRNLRPYFHFGLVRGLLFSAVDQYLLRGKAPWTLHYQADHLTLKKKEFVKPIDYPKPDGKLTFDKLSQVYLATTKHRENEPCHLILKDPDIPVAVNLALYDGPESRYCPAAVYEFIEQDGKSYLQINASNCIHCKTCDIKDPRQNIFWQVPEGGDGPNYQQL